MEIVLSHTSALAFWLSQPSRSGYPIARRFTEALPSGPFDEHDAEYAPPLCCLAKRQVPSM